MYRGQILKTTLILMKIVLFDVISDTNLIWGQMRFDPTCRCQIVSWEGSVSTFEMVSLKPHDKHIRHIQINMTDFKSRRSDVKYGLRPGYNRTRDEHSDSNTQ